MTESVTTVRAVSKEPELATLPVMVCCTESDQALGDALLRGLGEHGADVWLASSGRTDGASSGLSDVELRRRPVLVLVVTSNALSDATLREAAERAAELHRHDPTRILIAAAAAIRLDAHWRALDDFLVLEAGSDSLAMPDTAIGQLITVLLPADDEVMTVVGRMLAERADERHVLALAKSLRLQGKLEASVRVLETLLTQAPDSPEGWTILGMTLAELGDLPPAVASFDRALAREAFAGPVLRMKGDALRAGGQYTSALEAYRSALRADPDDVTAMIHESIALIEMKRYDEALVGLERAIHLDSAEFAAWYNKGLALGASGRYAEAISAYDTAIELNPTHADTWSNRGNALLMLGRHGEALDSYEHATTSNPESALAWHNKATLLSRLQRTADALAAHDRALALAPESSAFWNGKANTLARLKHYGEALAAYDRALTASPTSASTWLNKGITLAEMGRYDDAVTAFTRSSALAPNSAEPWFRLGEAQLALRRGRKAKEAYERALAISPHLTHAWVGLGQSQLELKQYDAALTAAERAIQMQPESTSGWSLKLRALEALGRADEAGIVRRRLEELLLA